MLAADISAEMLAMAAEQARRPGSSTSRRWSLDAQALDLAPASFDAAICRSGLMLMADPVAVLGRIRRALKPGGRLVGAGVRARPRQNPLQWLPTRIAREAWPDCRRPLRGEPGMFALGEPGRLEAAFEAAGFVDVVGRRRYATSARFGSAADAVRSLRDVLPSVHALLRGSTRHERERAWVEIEASAPSSSKGRMGPLAPGEMLLGHRYGVAGRRRCRCPG